MKTLLLQIWKDTNPIVALWVYSLMFMASTGILFMFYGLLSGEIDTSRVTFGIFDYCC
jgi:hypothetical protein